MACQSSLARLCATPVQRLKQDFRRGNLRLCNTCKGHARPWAFMCARAHICACAKGYTKGLQVLQPLHSLSGNGGFPPFVFALMCKGVQGYGHFAQGLAL